MLLFLLEPLVQVRRNFIFHNFFFILIGWRSLSAGRGWRVEWKASGGGGVKPPVLYKVSYFVDLFDFHIFFFVFSSRAIEESLMSSYNVSEPSNSQSGVSSSSDLISFESEDKELLEALSLSLKEQSERDKNRKLEDEMLQRALQISITDK